MHVTGRYTGATFKLDGSLVISFQINEKDKCIEELPKIYEVEKLRIDAVKYREKRSLDANGYFWQLADKMAKALNSDKWTVYLIQLSKYGVFTDLKVRTEAVPIIQRQFRYVEVLGDTVLNGVWAKNIRCYLGSSTYDTKEMSDLIEGTVKDAKDLGIETLTPDEIKALLSAWKGETNNYERKY